MGPFALKTVNYPESLEIFLPRSPAPSKITSNDEQPRARFALLASNNRMISSNAADEDGGCPSLGTLPEN
jgi:hypothetical protein